MSVQLSVEDSTLAAEWRSDRFRLRRRAAQTLVGGDLDNRQTCLQIHVYAAGTFEYIWNSGE